jgi:hypothetical protein
MISGVNAMHPDYLTPCSSEWLGVLCKEFFAGLLLIGTGLSTAMAEDLTLPPASPARLQYLRQSAVATSAAESLAVVTADPKRADFERVEASKVARQVADWVLDSGDHGPLPFMIVDKKEAKVFAFYADGRLRGAAFALLGLALGDDSVPGIGKRSLASILPIERTTPAGRFVASLGRNLQGDEILWVDYEAAISLHAVITRNPKEHRAQRLATPSPLDNRISYGCINVPADFFKNVVLPTFKGTNGIVYVLPETRSAQAVFGSYDVDEHARLVRTNPR